MSEEKNLKIKDTLRATKERRSQMDCRAISVKIQENKLSRAKEEKLNRCFLEAKWLRNAVVATDSLSLEDTSSVQVKVKDTFEVREIKNLSSQMKQSVVDSVKTDVSNLSKAKKAGLKVGRLQYKHECNEINSALRNSTDPIVLRCLEASDYHDWYLMRLLRVQMAGNDIVVIGAELKNNYGRICSVENVVAVYKQDDDGLIKLFDMER